MHKTIISDTSCLILLDKIGELEILNKLFGTIIITPEVLEEFHFRTSTHRCFVFSQSPVDTNSVKHKNK